MGVFFALPIDMNKLPTPAEVRFRAALSPPGKLKLRRRCEIWGLISTLTVTALSVVAIGGGWQPEPMEFPGKFDGTILQITTDGMRVEGVFHRDINAGNPDFGGEFFLKGYPGSAADGEAVSSVPSLPAGFYTYTTVLGAERTIRALRCTTESYGAR